MIGEEVWTFPPTTPAARVKTNTVLIGMVDEFPLYQVVYEDIEGLPDPMEDTVYVVSAIVATAVRDRPDVVAPDTGSTSIRLANGLFAVRGFLKY